MTRKEALRTTNTKNGEQGGKKRLSYTNSLKKNTKELS